MGLGRISRLYFYLYKQSDILQCEVTGSRCSIMRLSSYCPSALKPHFKELGHFKLHLGFASYPHYVSTLRDTRGRLGGSKRERGRGPCCLSIISSSVLLQPGSEHIPIPESDPSVLFPYSHSSLIFLLRDALFSQPEPPEEVQLHLCTLPPPSFY